MTGWWWWDLLIGIAAALAVTWLALLVTLAIVRPRGGLLHQALRLLPDVLRLVRRLSAPTPTYPAACACGSRSCWPTWPSPSTWCPTSSPCWATPTTPSSSPRCSARWCGAPG
jgi:hypothetical protein